MPRFKLLHLYAVLNFVLASTNQSREEERYFKRSSGKRLLKHKKKFKSQPGDFSVTFQLLPMQSTIRNWAEIFSNMFYILLQISSVFVCTLVVLIGVLPTGIPKSYFYCFLVIWPINNHADVLISYYFRTSMPLFFLTRQISHESLFSFAV